MSAGWKITGVWFLYAVFKTESLFYKVDIKYSVSDGELFNCDCKKKGKLNKFVLKNSDLFSNLAFINSMIFCSHTLKFVWKMKKKRDPDMKLRGYKLHLKLFTSSDASHHNPIITPTESRCQIYSAESASALPQSQFISKRFGSCDIRFRHSLSTEDDSVIL